MSNLAPVVDRRLPAAQIPSIHAAGVVVVYVDAQIANTKNEAGPKPGL
jgi:hypothetical protein